MYLLQDIIKRSCQNLKLQTLMKTLCMNLISCHSSQHSRQQTISSCQLPNELIFGRTKSILRSLSKLIYRILAQGTTQLIRKKATILSQDYFAKKLFMFPLASLTKETAIASQRLLALDQGLTSTSTTPTTHLSASL